MKRYYLGLASFGLFSLSLFFFLNGFYKAETIMFWYDLTGGEPGFKKEGSIHFTDETGIERAVFDTEIADDDVSRELGLMFRKKMDENRSMVFIFPDEQMRVFWMKNTRIPLDILFISADSTVVTVRAAERLFSTKPVASSKPAKFVVELNLGTAKKFGIREGDKFGMMSSALD